MHTNQELINRADPLGSVLSLRSRLEGDITLNVQFNYIKEFEFELEINSGEVQEYHYVSLDRDAPIRQGQSIYLEDVIERNSKIVEAFDHLGTRIASEGNDKFSIEDAKNLEGSYLISYGNKGDNLPSFENGELIYPFDKSITSFISSDTLSNIFLFNDIIDKRFQERVVRELLVPNNIVGIVNIPESVTTQPEIQSLVIEDSLREYLLYTYGRFEINDTLVSNSFYYAINSNTGNFKNQVLDNTLPIIGDREVKGFLENLSINNLSRNKDYYFVNEIININRFLHPHYLLIANYIKIYMTRYLSGRLGTYAEDLRPLVDTELSKISNYSSLIDSVVISNYSSNFNSLSLGIGVELRGLIGSSLDVVITINK